MAITMKTFNFAGLELDGQQPITPRTLSFLAQQGVRVTQANGRLQMDGNISITDATRKAVDEFLSSKLKQNGESYTLKEYSATATIDGIKYPGITIDIRTPGKIVFYAKNAGTDQPGKMMLGFERSDGKISLNFAFYKTEGYDFALITALGNIGTHIKFGISKTPVGYNGSFWPKKPDENMYYNSDVTTPFFIPQNIIGYNYNGIEGKLEKIPNFFQEYTTALAGGSATTAASQKTTAEAVSTATTANAASTNENAAAAGEWNLTSDPIEMFLDGTPHKGVSITFTAPTRISFSVTNAGTDKPGEMMLGFEQPNYVVYVPVAFFKPAGYDFNIIGTLHGNDKTIKFGIFKTPVDYGKKDTWWAANTPQKMFYGCDESFTFAYPSQMRGFEYSEKGEGNLIEIPNFSEKAPGTDPDYVNFLGARATFTSSQNSIPLTVKGKTFPIRYFEFETTKGTLAMMMHNVGSNTKPGTLLVGTRISRNRIAIMYQLTKTPGYDFVIIDALASPLKIKFGVIKTEALDYDKNPLQPYQHYALHNCDEQDTWILQNQTRLYDTKDGLEGQVIINTAEKQGNATVAVTADQKTAAEVVSTSTAANSNENDEIDADELAAMESIMAEVKAQEEQSKQQKNNNEKQKIMLNAYPPAKTNPPTTAKAATTTTATTSTAATTSTQKPPLHKTKDNAATAKQKQKKK